MWYSTLSGSSTLQRSFGLAPGARIALTNSKNEVRRIIPGEPKLLDEWRNTNVLTAKSTKVRWLLVAYVLMGNHYHFLLETPEPNLVRGMAWF